LSDACLISRETDIADRASKMATVLSIMVLMIIASLAGAAYIWRRPGGRRRALLLLVLAAVIAANLALLVAPLPDGESPLGKVAE
jgi:hypothetical protein